MSDVRLQTLDDKTLTLSEDDLSGFAAGFRGDLVKPGDPTYDEVRAIWNGMIDRRPGLIVRCRGASDVMHAVRFVSDRKVRFSVRGAGHNIAGNSLCEAGVLIDLSEMRGVRVDERERTVRVEPGATLGDLDRETQAFGLAVPTGINSTTGIAGLTLGGGFGWLGRKYGMTIDNLLSADVVTADGNRVTASESSHPDLFWGIRGGGGNFGIVTSFEFRCHEVGPDVMSGLVVYPLEKGKELFRSYLDFTANSPDELTTWIVMRKAPPLPFLPGEVHGTEVMIFAFLYTGDVAEGEKLVQPLRKFGTPVGEAVLPHPFTGWQSAFDPLLAPGARNYWKTHNFTELSDGAIAAFLDHAGKLPSPMCEVFIAQMGGAQARVKPDATPYVGRDAAFVMNVHARWEDPKDDDACVGWARSLFQATTPHASGSAYINFMTEEEGGRVQDAYGANYARLAQVKAKYDPGNLFRVNQNIAPAK